jgi:hypothetical protein
MLRRDGDNRRPFAATLRVVWRGNPCRWKRLKDVARTISRAAKEIRTPVQSLGRAFEGDAQDGRRVIRHEIRHRGKHLSLARDLRMPRTLTAPTSLAANRRQRAQRDFFMRQDEVFAAAQV